MTRETAIKGLKAFRKEFSGYEPNEEMFDMAIKALEQKPCDTCRHYENGCHWLPSVTPQEPRVDFKELKRKILMEIDGGTDDAWLAYGEVCNRISNAIDEFVSDMRGEEV